LVALGLVLALAGCGSDDADEPDAPQSGGGSTGAVGGGPEVSPDGQVQYACSLAKHVEEERGDPADWKGVAGPDADPGAVEAAAVSSLLGGTAGYELPEHPELSAAASDLTAAVMRVDLEQLSSSLEKIVAGCADISGEQADVSEAGRVDFACRLADQVVEEHGSAETWDGLGKEPAWHQAASVGALVGGMNGYVVPGSEDLSEAGKRIFSAIARLETAELDDALDAFIAGCAD